MDLDLSLLGWVHTVASLCALAIGAMVLVRPKGTPRHRTIGKLYLVCAFATSVTALGIYRYNAFYFPHWLGIAALIALTLGFLCVRFRRPRTLWLNFHMTSMIASYYLLVGGGVNEAFLRVDILRATAPDGIHSPLVGLVHMAVATAFLGLIFFFNIRRSRWLGLGKRLQQVV
jgi:uncharacterized membrane protein